MWPRPSSIDRRLGCGRSFVTSVASFVVDGTSINRSLHWENTSLHDMQPAYVELSVCYELLPYAVMIVAGEVRDSPYCGKARWPISRSQAASDGFIWHTAPACAKGILTIALFRGRYFRNL